ncbi:MAG: hypothetical protein WKF41_05540 [Gaiellaceae bacterium]
MAEAALMGALSALTSDEAFERAFEEYATSATDPIAFLKERGVEIPAGAEITVKIYGASSEEAVAKQKERVCWEICVGPPFARFCYEKCKSR